jgi:hypothetical protein
MNIFIKTSLRLAFLGLIFTLAFFSCNKSSSTAKTDQKLVLSASSIKRGQPLVANINGGTPNSSYSWSVAPTTGTYISPNSNTASILFANAGTYQVTATNSADSAGGPTGGLTSNITVSDSIYTPVIDDGYDTLSLAGDQITLQPISATDSSGLVLLVSSNKYYYCNPVFLFGTEQDVNGDISMSFYQVVSGSAALCGDLQNKAISFLFFHGLSKGVHNVTANLNNAAYHGTLTITDTDYTFAWNYTSGVLISPLQINR